MDPVVYTCADQPEHGSFYDANVMECFHNPETNSYRLLLDISNHCHDAIFHAKPGEIIPVQKGDSLRVQGTLQSTGACYELRIFRLMITYNIATEKPSSPLSDPAQLELLIKTLHPCLRHFVCAVLSGDTGEKFRTVPASRDYHHCEPQGLLIHSMECALIAGSIAHIWLPRPEAEIITVAALLHDIGKCGTLNVDGTKTRLGTFMRHEDYGLELLAPHLSQLDKYWHMGANLLRHILSSGSSGSRFPEFPGTLLVKAADQLSTALDRRNRLFNSAPDYYFFQFDERCQQKYLRLGK